MRNMLRGFMAIALCLLAAVRGFALTETVDGITWSYTVLDGGACIVYTGSNSGPHGPRRHVHRDDHAGGGEACDQLVAQLGPEEAARRRYVKLGKVKLTDAEWTEVASGHEGDFNFFRVIVEMR